MKYQIVFFWAILTISATAQTVDSMAIKQVDSLILVSRDLTAKGEFDRALEVNATAESLALEKLGRESAAYGSCAFNRGRVNDFKGNNPEAEKWYMESKEIREKALGREHPDYAWSLNNLGFIYSALGNYEKAVAYYLESKAIHEKVLGVEHPDYASSLNNLAILYSKMGRYEEAEPLYIEAISIQEKVVGVEHPDYAQNLHNLAILYMEMGRYEKAEPLYLKSIAILEKTLGPEHPFYASSLFNLAMFYNELGKYDQAEPIYLKVIAIQKTALGPTHLTYANTLNSLATFYHRIGDYKKAETFYLEAKVIREKALGVEHPYYASFLNNLAILYSDLGHYEKAKQFYFEAKAISEKVLGLEHPEYATSLHNLASLYWKMNHFKEAEPLFLQAKAIREKALGVDHPEYAESLLNLGSLYWKIGDYNKAEPFYLEACAVWKKASGEEHPTYTKCLTNLATLFENQFRYTESSPLFAKVLDLMQARIARGVSFLSEQELATYVSTQQGMTDLNTFLNNRPANQADILPALSYNQSLFQKGFLQHSASRLQRLANSSPEAIAINHDLKSYRRRIAQQLSKPITERKEVEELIENANLAEKELARTIAGYADAQKQILWQEVQSSLPATAIALEFVHFKVNFPEPTDSVMYAVLLLRPGASQPQFIPLFEAKELDHLLDGNKERKADYVNELYAWADRGMVKLGSEKKSLYDLIWSKIEETGLEGMKTVYYSPSGVLHRLNMGAIAIDDESILADRYNLVALNSTRQLVVPSTVTTKANDVLLVGGVNFEVDSIDTFDQDEPLLASRSAAEAWTESGTRGGSWSDLKWTEKEVNRIAETFTNSNGGFEIVQLTGVEASEEAIKAVGSKGPSPRVLHIATHGFFFPDPELAPALRRGLGEVEPVFKNSDNPMIRSGLILAGGNYAWQHGRAVSPEREDGILTAYEISQMNLSNTELVVLSACETGLGDIKGNEGVYGLQRAFKIAGAKYLIMSLWQVPDRETMEFMTTFYRNWLEENMTIPDAFRKTQREMRDRFFNPYSWAGFVLVE